MTTRHTTPRAHDAAPTQVSAGGPVGRGGPVVPARSTLAPLGLDEIEVTGGFWADYQELNATAVIDHCLDWTERMGWMSNFDRAADGTIGAGHSGIEFVDSEIYKLLEAMAWELGRKPSAHLRERFDDVVRRVAAAQSPDGYLNTSFGREGQRARYSDLEWGHELYCAGHLIQAAVACLRTGVDEELPRVARAVADHLYREFGPDGRRAVGGHPEIEPALVELARATGERRYLELAGLFVERRGTGTLGQIDFGAEYFQDDVPVRDATVLRGHSVRALYLSAGALDFAVETADEGLAAAIKRQWSATVARRAYITGGLGSHHRDEAFGEDFELPHDRAYSETCAGIASVMLGWRLLLDEGGAAHADLIERTLLNNVLASPREDGRAFFYANTLHLREAGSPPSEVQASPRAESTMRAPWFEVSCCPTNVARTLASAHLYFATKSPGGVQLHQYGTYRVDTTVDDGRLAFAVASEYPLDGRVTVTVESAPGADASIALRLPRWAGDGATWDVSTASAEAEIRDGYLHVSGALQPGDTITLELPMAARFVYPPYAADDVRGQVAVERGPLVLALESSDLPEGFDTEYVALDREAGVDNTPTGARVTLRRVPVVEDAWPYTDRPPVDPADTARVDLIPYHRWANRGPSTMRVFIPLAP